MSNFLVSKSQKQDYVGLGNQGATCYMNSLLQTLFMTPEFRQQLYKWEYSPEKHGDPEDSIPYQLSLLFSKLQTGNNDYVETTGLIKSFQWESREAFHQHDVQEFCRVLFDAIEVSVQGTCQANVINELYQGTYIDFVRCLKCQQESCREDKYLDLSLTIRNEFEKVYNKSVEMALAGYVKCGELNGDNKYYCEKCKCKNDAVKGLKFKTLPKILALQLKRFDLDLNTLQRFKLNDRVSFPEILNMNTYLSKSSPPVQARSIKHAVFIQDHEVMTVQQSTDKRSIPLDSFYKKKLSGDKSYYLKCERNKTIEKYLQEGPNVYELFSVIVHSGSALGGHYYAYIKSFENSKWYNFNDSSVSEISPEDIHKVYGGQNSSSYSYSSNAYLLMYRKVDLDNSSKFDLVIPGYLKEQINRDNDKKKQEQKEREEKERMFKVKIVYKNIEKSVEAKRESTIAEFTAMLIDLFEIKETIENVRLRGYSSYYETMQEPFEDSKTLDEAGIYTNKVMTIETKQPDESFLPYDPTKILVRVHVMEENKSFEELTAKPTLLQVDKKESVKTLMEMIAKECKIPVNKQMITKRSINSQPEFITSGNLANQTLAYARIYEGTSLFVESSKDGKSKWMKMLEEEQGKITIKFNTPNDPSESQDLFKFSAIMDKQRTVTDLRNEIGRQLELEDDKFILKKYSSFGNELKEITMRLNQLNLFQSSNIFVELGTPVKADEVRVRFLIALNPKLHDSDGSIFTVDNLIELPVSQNLKISQIKELLRTELIMRYPTMTISVSNMRFRFNVYSITTKILNNNDFLREYKPSDRVDICLQLLKQPERILEVNDLIVYVKVWCPNTWELSQPYEIIINKNLKISELGASISRETGIDVSVN